MDTLENFSPEPVSSEQENLRKAIDTFEREIRTRHGDIHAAAIEVFRMMTGN
tara:strand:- start:56605 stop:56760 length:156 start_codon:yes stop_codon:yes gene_type:complete